MTTQPTLQMIDPATLIIDTNVRLDPKQDRAFVASIRQHGVLSAITGQADEDGQVHVRMGQRRTLAAIEAKRDEVPVMVLPAATSEDEAARIIEQLAENDHRAPITDHDRVAAVDALTGMGLSAAQIQKKTNRPKAEVEAARRVNGYAYAREQVEAAALTLEQAAVLTEFEDDPEAVERLTTAATEGRGFEHTAQRLRDQRDRDALEDATAQELAKEGITVLDFPASTESEHPNAVSLNYLVNDDADRSDVTAEDHRTCEGHAASVRIVPTFEGDEKWRAVVTYCCTDPAKYGHRDRYASAGTEKKKAADMTEEEREQAKAERREVIENNKAWASAETVRREWLATYLTRKTAPKDAAKVIGTALAKGWRGGAEVDHQRTGAMLGELGIDASEQAVEKASQSRALVLVLARVLAAYEAQTDRSDWRHENASTRAYLTWIATQGYDLSEVEQRAAGQDT